MPFKLQRLKLENWKNFPDLTLDFVEGLNLILGKNYSGKTSCIQAIYYALTGNVGPNQKAKAAQKDIAEQKKSVITAGAKTAKVTLDIAINQVNAVPKIIRISRSIAKSGKDACNIYEMKNGSETETGVALEEMLGASGSTLDQFLFLKEGEIFEAIYKSSSNFTQLLEEYFGLAHYRTTLGIVKKLKDTYERERKDLVAKIKQPPPGVSSSDAAKLTQQKKNCESVLQGLQTQVKTIKTMLATKRTELAGFQAKIEASRQVSSLVTDYTTKQARFKAELAELETALGKLNGKYQQPSTDATRKHLNAERARLSKEISTITQSISGKKSALSEFAREIQRYKNESDQIQTLAGTCPTCRQVVDEAHKQHVLDEIRGKKEDVEEQLAVAQGDIGNVEEQAGIFDAELQALISDSSQLDQLESNLGLKKSAIADATANLTRLRGEDTSTMEQHVKVLEEDIQKIQKDQEDLELKISPLTKEQARIEATLGMLQQSSAHLEQESEKLFNWTKNLAALHQALDETIEEFRNRQLSTIKRSIEEYWKEFREEDATLDWNDQGLPQITFQGKTREYRNFSESERCVILLATKLSILEAVLGLHLFVVDEPFHHFSPDRAVYVVSVLKKFRDLMQGTNTALPWQIICTSFNPQVKDAANWDKVIML